MLIEEIELKNFLSHKDTRVGFSTGVNIIIGKNGAGKSSIVDGMRMALFGSAEIERRMVSYRETEATVRIRFRHNMHEYEIARTVENKKGKENTKHAVILKDGVRIGEGANEVNQAVERELEIGKVAFINSVYVKQGDIDGLVTSRPAERKDIMSEIIGLKDYDRALKNLDPVIKNLELETRDYEAKRASRSDIATKIEELEQEIELGKKRKADLESEMTSAEEKRNDLSSSIGIIQKRKEEMEHYEKDLREKMKEVHSLKDEIEKLAARKEEYDSIRNEYEKLIANPLFVRRNEMRQVTMRLQEINRLQDELRSYTDTLEKLGNYQESLKAIQGDYEEYMKTGEILSQIEKDMAGLKKGKEEFDRITGTYNDLQSRKAGLVMEIGRISGRLSGKIDPGLISMDYVERTREERRETLRGITGKIASEGSRAASLKEKVDEIREKMEKLSSAPLCPLCGQNIDDHKHEEIFGNFKEEIRKAEAEIKGSDDHIRALTIKQSKVSDELKILESRDVNDYISRIEMIKQVEEEEKRCLEGIRNNREYDEKYRKAESEINRLRVMMTQLEKHYREYLEIMSKIDYISNMKIGEKIENTRKEIEKGEVFCKSFPDVMDILQKGSNLGEVEKIEKDADSLFQKLKDKDSIIEMERKDQMLRGYQEEISTIRKKIEEIQGEISEEEGLRGELSMIQEKIRQISEEREGFISIISGKGSTVKQLGQDLEETDKYLHEVEGSFRQLKFLSILKKAISRDGIPKALRGIAVESISAQARNIISRFNLAIEDVRLSEDLDVEIMQDGSVKDISQLSGGERTALAIGIRLAIAKYLGGNMSTIIMDEPTIYLDEERRNDLRDIIKYSIKELSDENIFPQIIIITHHEELETAADVVYEVRKDDGVSFVSTTQ